MRARSSSSSGGDRGGRASSFSEHALEELARLYGVTTSYRDVAGVTRRSQPEALIAVLRALGAGLEEGGEGVLEATARRKSEIASRVIEPVIVSWDGGSIDLLLRLPSQTRGSVLAFDLLLEDGGTRTWTVPRSELQEGVDGALHASLPGKLPFGYHRLRLEAEEVSAEALLLSAPLVAYRPVLDGGDEDRSWGVFAPTYALSSEDSWGVGSFSDLGRLLEWVRGLGGQVVQTLPLLAAYLEEPFEVSPYSPVSRLFWNELFIDVGAIPELARCSGARDLVTSRGLALELAQLRTLPRVDYRRAARARRPVLTELARCFFTDPDGQRMASFRAFLAARPQAEDYAGFRAAVDRRRQGWTDWPASLRDGGLTAADYDETDRHYHLYCQFIAEEQLAAAAGSHPGNLYLDLPLGVNPAGYDTWRHRGSFAFGVSAGAPPDGFFTQGQDWGFQPLHPERMRAEGYHYLVAALRHQMFHARYLRIDHIMGLHRVFWVPQGLRAAQGVYVSYPAEELYAILALEARRNRCTIVGEDLGTVPDYVRPTMKKHGVRRMYVLQYEARPQPGAALPPVPSGSVASLNTHDMPPFAAFLEGADIEERAEQGHLAPESLPEERLRRRELVEALSADLAGEAAPPVSQMVDEAHAFLASSQAELVLVNLEDLWHETETQNMPGSGNARPNWRRKLAYELEDLREQPLVTRGLRRVAELRAGAGEGEGEGESREVRHPVSPQPGGLTDRVGTDQPAAPGQPVGGRQAPAGAPDRVPSPPPAFCSQAGAAASVREWSLVSDDDIYLFNEGSHLRLFDHLGSRPMTVGDADGTHFSVWAPNADKVSVIGDFNEWDPRCHPLIPRASSGIWEGFLPGVAKGAVYKYHIVSRHRGYRVDKADPFGWHHETPPRTGSIVCDLDYQWGDAEWMASRSSRNSRQAPQSVYEVHLGSWMRTPEEGGRSLSYREIAPRLAEYAKDLGFTHVELLPVMEHPFYGSWGYQTTGYFAPTSRYGAPQDLMFLIDHLHQHGIGVILDWVPSHFPSDEHGLAYFDGTHLFEHSDPRQGFHPDWQSYIFNYGRHEVRSFLLSSALFWLEKFHADGLRVDAVASMLYLDYSRKVGEWIPNKYGGRENLEAIDFLRRLNSEVYRHFPDTQTIAEESTSWPMVSRPTYLGGLGFGLKWDMGWMHDTLNYMAYEPVHRKYHHDGLTFRMIYAFTENFLLPLSHDEVVHGKGSLLGRMPGDDWQKFANLRLLLTYMYGSAGKKLLFMGGELGQWREWDHDGSIDWHLLQYEPHGGVQRLTRELNRLYREEPALHELDLEPEGFEWIAADDSEQSVISFLRRGRSSDEVLLFALNFTPVPRYSYLVGAPYAGFWREVFNSDAKDYGGSGHGNMGGVEAAPLSCHGRPYCLALTLPPLGAVVLKNRGGGGSEDGAAHDLPGT